MNANRIAMLEKYRLEDPTEPFYPYALALEYWHTQPERARELFTLVLKNHADYLPAYYMAGTFFQQENPEQAMAIFRMGLELAKRLNDSNTQRELQAALDNLTD